MTLYYILSTWAARKSATALFFKKWTILGGSLGVRWGSWGVREVLGGIQRSKGGFGAVLRGPLEKVIFFFLKVKLSNVSWSIDVFSLVWFCEAVGGHSVTLLFHRFWKLAFCETVMWILHKKQCFVNDSNMASSDAENMISGREFWGPGWFILMEIPIVLEHLCFCVLYCFWMNAFAGNWKSEY